MDAQAGLLVDLEEDLGLSELAPENDQRTSVFLLHLELIRFELGFLGVLDADTQISWYLLLASRRLAWPAVTNFSP